MKNVLIVFLITTTFTLKAQQGFVMLNQNKIEFANQGKA